MNHVISEAIVGLAHRLGRFERILLSEISAAGDDAYCAELSRRLSRSQNREVTMGQVSRTLGTLKRLGLLEAEQRWPATPAKNQRHRLVFSLTPSGRTALNALSRKRSAEAVMAPAL